MLKLFSSMLASHPEPEGQESTVQLHCLQHGVISDMMSVKYKVCCIARSLYGHGHTTYSCGRGSIGCGLLFESLRWFSRSVLIDEKLWTLELKWQCSNETEYFGIVNQISLLSASHIASKLAALTQAESPSVHPRLSRLPWVTWAPWATHLGTLSTPSS